jgi:hypothetical protein
LCDVLASTSRITAGSARSISAGGFSMSDDADPSQTQLQDATEAMELVRKHAEALHFAIGEAVCEYFIQKGIRPAAPPSITAACIVMIRSAYAMLRIEPGIADPKGLVQWVVDNLPDKQPDTKEKPS